MRPNPVLLTILSALACDTETFQATACFNTEAELEQCPPAAEVAAADLYLAGLCGDDLQIISIDGEGTVRSVQGQAAAVPGCCYPVTVVDTDTNAECTVGRPYRDGQEQRRARVDAGDVDDPRAIAWLRAGELEHASVAAFARLSLQLMACGAPSSLLAEVHQAAREETEHAEACWAMARQLGASVTEIGAFPFSGPIDARVDLLTLAAEAVREGCVVETLGAHLSLVAAEACRDPEIRAVLLRIANDEARHAALSFRIVAWAIQVGGARVRNAVEAAFAESAPRIDVAELALRAGIRATVLTDAARAGIDEVVQPAAAALLVA
jgi:hypothetical protein